MELVQSIAIGSGLAWASGLRLYAVVFFTGLLGKLGYFVLPGDLQVLAHPAVIAVTGVLFFVEFLADKVPGFDSLWDALHTFIRIPAGAVLAAGAIGLQDPALALAAALLGGTLASGSHFAKSGSRALVNTSPEPFSNWGLSIGEDIASLGGVWLAFVHPLFFLGVLFLFVLLMLWLLPKLWKGVRRVWAVAGGAERRREQAP